MEADSLAKCYPNTRKFIGPKFWNIIAKRLHWASLFCALLGQNSLNNKLVFYSSPRTFLVQMSSPSVSTNGDVESLEKSVIDETELVNKCWEYTWKGPVNDNTNKSTSCDTSPDRSSFSVLNFESCPI